MEEALYRINDLLHRPSPLGQQGLNLSPQPLRVKGRGAQGTVNMGIPSTPDPQPKVPVVRRSDYILYFEQPTATETFIHCDVLVPWSACARRRLAADWQTLLALHGGPIRALHTPGDTKHLKFLTTFGFRYLASYVDRVSGPKDIYTT